MRPSHSSIVDPGPSSEFTPGIPGFTYADLHHPARLADLLANFEDTLRTEDAALFDTYQRQRTAAASALTPQDQSELLVRLAPHVGAFVARLFGVTAERSSAMVRQGNATATLSRFRAEVIAKAKPAPDLADRAAVVRAAWQGLVATLGDPALDPELRAATVAVRLLDLAKQPDADACAAVRTELNAPASDDAVFAAGLFATVSDWCALVRDGKVPAADTAGWVSFKEPAKVDATHLVHHDTEQRTGHDAWVCSPAHLRRRDGFALTDARATPREVQYEVDHCIYCHERDTDSCAKGMRNKRAAGEFKSNALGVPVTGCPLGEKISEMNLVKRHGDDIGALALIVIDNPMCPGTGHRICNDCMKGCIYQKTEPVNIPQIETRVLTDVLALPWGFEIWSFLTRWNPLNLRRPHALPYNGKNVLVVGMGPAGYTLAHYLLNEGFGVTGIDALKIEPLPEELTGAPGRAPQPVRDHGTLVEGLDTRGVLGFGGVAEYGITVRWDKNFLKLIYLNLARRAAFRVHGGVRFGGTLSVDDAWALGFDHIAIAIGAGQPTVIGMKNNLLRGVRKASDFLMALQLTGAARGDSLANLQMRLPVGVIGGGLTAVDTATEALAYYPVQVEKILARHEALVAESGAAKVRARYDAEEAEVLEEFLAHGRAIRAERERARAAGEAPDFARLVNEWGGVTLFYRKQFSDAPAYRQNHEEVVKALEEGIRIAEGMNPEEAFADQYGALEAVRFSRRVGDEKSEVKLPLRSLFVAAGTSPNTIYDQEHPNTFTMEGRFFARHEPERAADGSITLNPMHDTAAPKLGRPAPFTSYQKDGRFITFYGDNHPVYAGNVVKAMASAKDGYPYVVDLFRDHIASLKAAEQPRRDAALAEQQARFAGLVTATVREVKRLTPTIVEVIVHAPLQARGFQPGQFYRVQNFERLAPVVNGTRLAVEGLALTGAWVDKDQGLISLITLEMGASSRLCATWQPGDPVVVMGVTGAPTEIEAGETVMLVGGGLGNAVQFSIGKALRAAGSKVIYFAGYRNSHDVFKVSDIEAAADVIVWAVDPNAGAQLKSTRPQDFSFVGNIVEAILAYGEGRLGTPPIPLSTVDRMVVIGSDRMMAAVKEARFGVLKPLLKPGHVAIGSINSPMQCMMKGVCAQCLCRHVDPDTGKETFVYSCANQDQALDRVDFAHLAARLRQNSVQEKLADDWLNHLFAGEPGVRRV